jgi:hypothetical protein
MARRLRRAGAQKTRLDQPEHSEGSTFRIYFLSPHNVICSREDAR